MTPLRRIGATIVNRIVLLSILLMPVICGLTVSSFAASESSLNESQIALSDNSLINILCGKEWEMRKIGKMSSGSVAYVIVDNDGQFVFNNSNGKIFTHGNFKFLSSKGNTLNLVWILKNNYYPTEFQDKWAEKKKFSFVFSDDKKTIIAYNRQEISDKYRLILVEGNQ